MKTLSLLSIFFGFMLSYPPTPAFAVEGNLDAQCSASVDEMVPLNGGIAHQTFITNYDRITGISIYFGFPGGEPASMNVYLRRADGSNIAGAPVTVSETKWYTVEMPGFEVTRGGTYQVAVQSDPMEYTWGKTSTNCYSGGTAYANETYPVSGDWLFKTYGRNSDSTPPILSNISVSNITKTGAALSWQSDETSVVQIEYGTTTSYGTTKESTGPGATTYTFSGLNEGTTYHFRIRGVDAVTNWSDWSTDQSFVTATDAASGTSTPSNTSATSVVSTSTKTQTIKTVDTSIAAPVLAYALQGANRTNAPFAELSLASGDTFKLGGTSFANAIIAIFLNEKTFSATADKEGNWEATIDTTGVADGQYKIKAQAQDTAKNKGSQEIELFSLNIIAKAEASTSTEVQTILEPEQSIGQKITNKYKWYSLGILILLIGLAGLIVYLAKTGKLPRLFKRKNTTHS